MALLFFGDFPLPDAPVFPIVKPRPSRADLTPARARRASSQRLVWAKASAGARHAPCALVPFELSPVWGTSSVDRGNNNGRLWFPAQTLGLCVGVRARDSEAHYVGAAARCSLFACSARPERQLWSALSTDRRHDHCPTRCPILEKGTGHETGWRRCPIHRLKGCPTQISLGCRDGLVSGFMTERPASQPEQQPRYPPQMLAAGRRGGFVSGFMTGRPAPQPEQQPRYPSQIINRGKSRCSPWSAAWGGGLGTGWGAAPGLTQPHPLRHPDIHPKNRPQ